MTRHDDFLSVRQMRDHAAEAINLADGRTRHDLESDRVFELALTRLLEILGEAAGRVSITTRNKCPGIAWSSIVGLRNRLIDGYDQVDFDILWEIVSRDLPPLLVELELLFDPGQ
jgi:uncharacterized protein with HEPN domain